MKISSLVSKPLKLNTGLEAGQRICVIGDIHGNADHMAILLDAFEKENSNYDKTTLVLLGDLIDRGKQNLVAINLAIKANDRFDQVISLQGNHEAMMRIVLTQDRQDITQTWLKHGGQDVLDEIGMQNLDFSSKDKFKSSMAKAVGAECVAYLENMQSHFKQNNLLFVHAGTHPEKSLEEHFAQPWDQTFGDHWCWIREKFLSYPVQFENLTIVHGHTPVRNRPHRNPDMVFAGHVAQGNKLNLDGGSYASGCVTGAEFMPDAYKLHAALVYK